MKWFKKATHCDSCREPVGSSGICVYSDCPGDYQPTFGFGDPEFEKHLDDLEEQFYSLDTILRK